MKEGCLFLFLFINLDLLYSLILNFVTKYLTYYFMVNRTKIIEELSQPSVRFGKASSLAKIFAED